MDWACADGSREARMPTLAAKDTPKMGHPDSWKFRYGPPADGHSARSCRNQTPSWLFRFFVKYDHIGEISLYMFQKWIIKGHAFSNQQS